MKYLLWIATVIYFILFQTVSAWFNGQYSQVTWKQEFNKINGRHTLYIQQENYINPFAGSRITVDQNDNYTVNGRSFNGGHPLWRYRNGRVPNQRVSSPIREQKVYQYDTTSPTCGSVTLYTGLDVFNPSEWTNQDVVATLSCVDTFSGCESGNISGLVMSHRDTQTPQTTFSDQAGNSNTCSSSIDDGKSVLIDKRLPAIGTMYFGWTDLDTQSQYFEWTDLDTQSQFKADNTQFKFSFIDSVTTNYGVSGIKSYDLSVMYLSDYSGNIQNTEVCHHAHTYTSYNPAGVINRDDDRNETVECSDMYRAGQYLVDLIVRDDAWNEANRSYPITIYPNDEIISWDLTLVEPALDEIYANNSDSYLYQVTLTGKHGNPLYNKKITGLNQAGVEWDFQTITTNMVNGTGVDALKEIFEPITNDSGQFNISLYSLAPGVFSESFFMTLSGWDEDYENNSTLHQVYANTYNTNSFRKPFFGNLSISDDALVLSKHQHALLNIIQQSCESCGNYNISNFRDSFTTTGNGFVVESSENEQGLNNDNPELDFILNHDGESILNIEDLWIQTVPHIWYQLWGHLISYILSESDSARDYDPITYDEGVFYGLQIIGNLQGQGKQAATGQSDNFSDINKIEIRKNIKTNAEELVKGFRSGQVLNGIKYVIGDYRMGSAPVNYETLIVKWNVIIDTNIWNRVGIIVLDGDIQLQDSVTDINAMIYADGALLSSGKSKTQLRIIGNIFTRNTIGGALGDGSNYLLPGGEITTEYDIARSYDLNFLRIGNTGWDLNANGIQDVWEYKNASTIVIYNPGNQINPPKGFYVK